MSEAVKPKATRQAFGEALLELGGENPHLVVLDADLSKSTRSELFAERYPDRFFEMGIAEQNMAGVAAGLAKTGKVAVCCSFACFVAGRFETVKISVAYSRANVKVVGTHAGVGIGADGYSQMGLEDVALMRSLPTMRVFQPADDIETAQVVRHMVATEGPAYIRLTRQGVKRVHAPDYRFEPGRLDVLREGKDVAIFATGGTVMHALEAAELLASKATQAAVVNVPSIKPLHEGDVGVWLERVPLIVSVEDHNVMGGMGSAVAEIIAAHGGGARLYRHGIHDTFGESGSTAELYAKFALDTQGIARVVTERLR